MGKYFRSVSVPTFVAFLVFTIIDRKYNISGAVASKLPF